MGCTPSSISYDHGTYISRHGRPLLSERDAWRIALAWRDQLRGSVWLELNSERLLYCVVPTFEWVRFTFYGSVNKRCDDVANRQKVAAYARAAIIAWFALSCCEGYSGVENPGFWRRVFDELLHPKDWTTHKERGDLFPYPSRLQINDSVGFFDHPDRPFPRIKLAHEGEDDDATIASVFLGRVSYEDKSRDRKLLRFLAMLQPFMLKASVMRSVPVELCLWKGLPTKYAELLRDVPNEGRLETHASASVRFWADSFQLHVQSVNIRDNQILDIHSLHSLIPSSDVKVVIDGILPSFVRDHQLWRGLLDHQEDSSSAQFHRCWRVSCVDVVQNTALSRSDLSVMCSALPHLKIVHSLNLLVHRYVKGTPVSIASSDWVWLGYAIFHPDAASTSGLKSLRVDLDGMTVPDVADLTRMAVGNNLLGDGATGYIEGLIRSGTEVMRSRESKDKPVLFTLAAESWVVLNVSTAEALNSQDHICVVIPGFGYGWILHGDIIEMRTRRAGESCIRALHVENYTDDILLGNEETLWDLLRVLGSRLTSLHFENSNHMSASTVQAILCLCPSLKSLRIHHDGSFWADEALAMGMPRLEELELTVHGRYFPLVLPHEHGAEGTYIRWRGDERLRDEWEIGPVRPLQELKPSCLPYLKVLHVTSARDGTYEQHQPILVSFLSQQPVLKYLHWSGGYHPSRTWVSLPKDRFKKDTRKFLAELPSEAHLSLGPLHLNCRLAFLSVIGAKAAQSSSVSQWGKDVMTQIFEYATSPSRREIHIDLYVQLSRAINSR